MASPSLDDLAAFAAVARRLSFRAAAVERGVSASALSQAVRDLEDQLGTRLLHRTTRSVALTEAGTRLLSRLAPALVELSAAVDAVHLTEGVPAGLLRINAPPPAVDLVLAPLISAFLKQHPRVRVEVVAESALVDIVAEGFDAGVRWDESLARDVVALPLCGPQRFVVVAAPELLARVGVPRRPQDLVQCPCLRIRFSSGRRPGWEFERGEERVVVDPEGPLVGSHGPLLLRAALDGVGFVHTFEGYVAEHVAAGRLVPVLDDWLPPFPGPRLYSPSRRRLPPPLQAFVDFVRARGREGRWTDTSPPLSAV
ncbi:MAG TPA: LysR family transcriptional regulator [Myxococcota bacterium]|nr:LysR family transcriptional regulator [Myxococcota bacterium]